MTSDKNYTGDTDEKQPVPQAIDNEDERSEEAEETKPTEKPTAPHSTK